MFTEVLTHETLIRPTVYAAEELQFIRIYFVLKLFYILTSNSIQLRHNTSLYMITMNQNDGRMEVQIEAPQHVLHFAMALCDKSTEY